jgi:Tfp pilus assembly protein PilN
MKLQFNLLPDVKQEYLKTKKTKRTVITAAVAASALSAFILVFAMVTVYIINAKQLRDADGDIKKYSNQLQAVDSLDKILTIQNQLKSIGTLHQSKHKVSRLYTFLPQVTPAHVCVSQMSLDMASNSISFQGSSESQKSVNTFVDTLKFTKYKVGGKDSGLYAFPSVVESQFGIKAGPVDKANSVKCQGAPAPSAYQLSVKFDPALFSNAAEIELSVPQGLVTTRSVLDDPSNIFNGDAGSSIQSVPSPTVGGQ